MESNSLPPSSESPTATAEVPASARSFPVQDSEPELDEQKAETPTFGGFGYGAVGAVAGSVTGASAHIERALGTDGVPGGLGWQLGGGGKMLLWGLVIGGKGFFLAYPETSTARGSSLLRGGGGGLDFGYAVVHRSDRIVCPFVGIGGIGLDLSVANISDEVMLLGSEEIEPNEDATFSGGFWYLEGGVGAHRFTMDHGGPELGVEFGVMASFASQRWKNAAAADVGLLGPEFVGAYLKITGGGGGFFLAE